MPLPRPLPSRLAAALTLALTLAAAAAPAQDLFDPAAQVGDAVVTNFEVIQREQLLTVLRRPGVTRQVALQEVIDDRLKLSAAAAADIVPDAASIDLGIEDFAARAGLSGAEFLDALAEVGIAPETMRDFIAANLAWGDLVRTRFTALARPSEGEVDRALALGSGQGGARVLVSEVILPTGQGLAALSQERAEAIAEIDSFAEFEAAARQFSAAPTRDEGGRLGWLSLSELPPQIAPLFLTLQPGQTTPPVPVDGAIAVFQLRAIEDVSPPRAAAASLDYMRVPFPAGTDLDAERARLAARADTCGDLYGVFFGAPEQRLIRQDVPRAEVPAAIQTTLETLDPGEIGVLRRADGAGELVMLCGRTEERTAELTRDDVRRALFNQRLASYADAYLAELRAATFVARE